MKSNMMKKRQKSATMLVSPETFQQALEQAQQLGEQMLSQQQPGQQNADLDKIEQVASFLGQMRNTPNWEEYLDDAVHPNEARRIKGAVNMISALSQQGKAAPVAPAVPVPAVASDEKAAAGSGADNFITDRDEAGNPKKPEVTDANRYAARKKKEAEPIAEAAPVAAPAPAPASAGPLAYVPTEMILKIVQDLPKQEGFESNKGMQDALVQMTELLKSRPVAAPKPAEGQAAPAAAPLPVAASKRAKSPEGWEGTIKDMKKHKDIDNPYALAWSMNNKGYSPTKSSHLVRRFGGEFVVGKLGGATKIAAAFEAARKTAGANGGAFFTWNQETGDVKEDGGRTPEVAQAHKLVDEKPAKLSRPETTLPEKLASEITSKKAVEKAQEMGKKLKDLYLDAKPICEVNSTRPVREAVEAIYAAMVLFDEAGKTLNKQLMQEEAEEEAIKIREDKKKKSSLFGGLRLAAAQGE